MSVERLNEYQALAVSTAAGLESEMDFAVLALGLAGEAGEVADLVKKTLGHGHPLPAEKLVEECGDTLWYLASLLAYLDVPLSVAAGININKLEARYPDGFSSERSINRG